MCQSNNERRLIAMFSPFYVTHTINPFSDNNNIWNHTKVSTVASRNQYSLYTFGLYTHFYSLFMYADNTETVCDSTEFLPVIWNFVIQMHTLVKTIAKRKGFVYSSNVILTHTCLSSPSLLMKFNCVIYSSFICNSTMEIIKKNIFHTLTGHNKTFKYANYFVESGTVNIQLILKYNCLTLAV